MTWHPSPLRSPLPTRAHLPWRAASCCARASPFFLTHPVTSDKPLLSSRHAAQSATMNGSEPVTQCLVHRVNFSNCSSCHDRLYDKDAFLQAKGRVQNFVLWCTCSLDVYSDVSAPAPGGRAFLGGAAPRTSLPSVKFPPDSGLSSSPPPSLSLELPGLSPPPHCPLLAVLLLI